MYVSRLGDDNIYALLVSVNMRLNSPYAKIQQGNKYKKR